MSENNNPARVFFGTELRRKRTEAGLTAKQLADALGCTPQWISTMESGRKISEQSAHDLDTFFKTDGHFHRVWKLSNDIELNTALPPGFPEYLEREAKAISVRVFNALLFTGLFQGEEYARTVLSYNDQSNLADRVAKRMHRQAIYTRETPAPVWLTLDEEILYRPIGGADVMRHQLTFLLEACDRPHVMLNVIPRRTGYHPGLTGSFTLLGFEDGTSVAYTESAGVGRLIEQPARVARFVVMYDSLRGHALPVDESRALVKAVVESL
jgi:transcriptional regulator with XRE-family HTH domain